MADTALESTRDTEPSPALPERARAARPRTSWVGHLGALFFSTFAATVRLLPLRLAYLLSDALAVVFYLYSRFHERRVAPLGRGMVRNHKIVFREYWTPRLSRRLMWAYCRHLIRNVVEFGRMARLNRQNVHKICNFDELEHVRALHRRGKGVISITGHVGNWELSSYAAALVDISVLAVARPIGEPALNEFLLRVRNRSGQQTLSKFNVVRALKSAIEEGACVGILADEGSPSRSVLSPFLGTPIFGNTTAARMQAWTGAPIVVATCQRESYGTRGQYRIRHWLTVEPTDYADLDPEDRIDAVTRRIFEALSEAVANYPEQYLWASRRWLERPVGETLGADGLPPRNPEAWARTLDRIVNSPFGRKLLRN